MARKNLSREIEIAAAQNIREYEYWQTKLSGEPVKSSFPYDFGKSGGKQVGMGLESFRLKGELYMKLKKLSKGSAHHLHILLLAALTVLLNKYTGNDDILIGTPIYRQGTEAEFINTMLVIRNQLHPGLTFKEFLMQVRQTVVEAVEHQAYPVELLPYKLGIPVPETGFEEDFPLFDVVLFLPDIHDKKYIRSIIPNIIFSFRGGGHYVQGEMEYSSSRYLEATAARIVDHFTRLLQNALVNPDLMVYDIEILSEEEKKKLLYDFNDTYAKYPEDKTIQQLFGEQAARTPCNIAVVGMTIGVNVGAKHSGHVHNENASPLQSLQSRQASHFTYRELDQAAGTLAGILINKGVGPDVIVGLMLERSIEMIAAVLGILKAGAAYLPIDPDYPLERKRCILGDSCTDVLLTTRSLFEEVEELVNSGVEKLRSLEVEIVFIEGCRGEPCVRPITYSPTYITHDSLTRQPIDSSTHQPINSSNLAYVIYTSGTTGTPRGVAIEQRSVLNTLYALHSRCPFERSDTYLLKTTYVFDVSVTELFGWFLGAGRMAILVKGGEKNPETILNTIAAARVTHLNFVPTMFNAFVSCLEPGDKGKLVTLKYIFLAGEVLMPEAVKKFKQFDNECLLENIYGPTEASIYASWYSLSDWDGRIPIPIGRPLFNNRLYVLDKNNRLKPPGIPGQLFISGRGLARGYLNNPELTAEKFASGGQPHMCGEAFRVQQSKISAASGLGITPQGDNGSPCHGDEKSWTKTFVNDKSFCGGSRGAVFSKSAPLVAEGIKLYKTGDLARWLPDGNIEFLSRIDHQVKIRGFRIELGEIEDCLLKHRLIKEAVVTVSENNSADKYLCAYIKVQDAEPVEENLEFPRSVTLDIPGIREYLSRTLPDYMIPSYFVQIDTLPLTPSGKVNRRSLPGAKIMPIGEYQAPQNKIEETLAAFWSEILHIKKEKIGVNTNFFHLGGHSLNAIAMLSKIHKEYNVKLELFEVFKAPTIREIASLISAVYWASDWQKETDRQIVEIIV